ncbi:MAG TPA: diacylglycerol kinase family protein [Ktedonobacteraceae bacterium]|nr:diacylglycerol kinase family protein [Ktedonobacteraceae bacterium]
MEPFVATGRPLVVLNPAANRGNMQQHRELARRKATEEGARYVETTRAGEAEELARVAASEGCPVIVVGGDGSVHEVVNGLLSSGRRVPLGIVGAGSGNDFAWNTLRLSREPAAALERAFAGELVDVDAGRVNDRYFANAFSVGLDADIAVAAQHLKRWPLMSGSRLYYASSLKQLLFGYQRCPHLSIKLDDGEWIDTRRYVLLAVSNGPTYGGGFRINPAADHSDGWFHVCAIRYLPLIRALRLLPIVQKGEHAHVPEVHFFQAQKVQIESLVPVNIQMDGETAQYRSFQAEILPGALWMRV